METIVEPDPVASSSRGAAVLTGVCAIGSGLTVLLTWPTSTAQHEGLFEEALTAYGLLMYAYVAFSVTTLGGLIVGLASRGLPRAAAALTAVGLALPWVVWKVETALVDPSRYVDPSAIIGLYPPAPIDPGYLSKGVPPTSVAGVALLVVGGVWMLRRRAVSS